jgi:hypothetical protein
LNSTADRVSKWVTLWDSLGLMADTKNADALGYNVTALQAVGSERADAARSFIQIDIPRVKIGIPRRKILVDRRSQRNADCVPKNVNSN